MVDILPVLHADLLLLAVAFLASCACLCLALGVLRQARDVRFRQLPGMTRVVLCALMSAGVFAVAKQGGTNGTDRASAPDGRGPWALEGMTMEFDGGEAFPYGPDTTVGSEPGDGAVQVDFFYKRPCPELTVRLRATAPFVRSRTRSRRAGSTPSAGSSATASRTPAGAA